MKDIQYTSEPWETDPEFDHEVVLGADERMVCDCNISVRTCEENQADARRIVAAVNACAGIPTEALEQGIVKALKGEINNLLVRIGMHSMEFGTGNIIPVNDPALVSARATVAKAEGK